MAKINYRTDKEALYIELEGRIDANNSHDVESEINAIRQENSGLSLVLDADKLEYISSAGLRVVLRLRKAEPSLVIINASSEVYGIFEMTGFTDMINVTKAFPRISIEGCEFIAKGANGAVYRYDDETIVKQYFSRDALGEIKQERENARKAFVLGVNTAIPYGIVRIGEGYGSVTELLNTTSLSRLIKENPDELDKVVGYFIDTVKGMHEIKVGPDEFPDYRTIVIDWAEFLKEHLPEDKGEKLCRLVQEIAPSSCLIHGDYHTNNVLMQNGEPIIIDLDTLATGTPILELCSVYNAFVGFGEFNKSHVEDFLGFDFDLAKRFWRLSLARYLETEDEKIIDEVENKARILGYVRILRRSIRRELDGNLIEFYKNRLIEALDKVETLNF